MNVYMLVNGEVVPSELSKPEFREWWAGRPDNSIVARDKIGEVEICTDFIFIDMRWSPGPDHIPTCFETMTFGPGERIQKRYKTLKEAQDGHAATVAEVKGRVASVQADHQPALNSGGEGEGNG